MRKIDQHAMRWLEKLSLLLDSDPEVIASMPIDEVREELRTSGVDTGPLIAKVRRMISEAVESRQTQKSATAPGAIAEKVWGGIKRLLSVEPWTAPMAALASPVSLRRDTRKLVVRTEELCALDIQPYLRVNVEKVSKGPNLHFMLEHLTDPKRPGRYVEPKKGTVQIHLIRPAPKEHLTVRLGSNAAGRFLADVHEDIYDYIKGEERQWQAEISVHPGAVWPQTERP